jgi:protein TonB
VRPISGGILNGKAVSLPAPLYPEIAKRARTIGTVVVEVVIDVSGRVIAAKAVSGPQMLREAAERAALLARFTPALLTGQPVKVTGTINYNFTL